MVTQEELDLQKSRLDGKETALGWLKAHTKDYDQSPASATKMGDYMKSHGLELTFENLEKAFKELTSQGVTFIAPVVPVEEPLPEVPDYFPKMETKKDIRNIPLEKFKELYHGVDRQSFKARLVAVANRGK